MPHVSKHEQIPRKGIHSDRDRQVQAESTLPRDELTGDIAGQENDGPFGSEKSYEHSSKLKSRTMKKSKDRTPIR